MNKFVYVGTAMVRLDKIDAIEIYDCSNGYELVCKSHTGTTLISATYNKLQEAQIVRKTILDLMDTEICNVQGICNACPLVIR